MPSQQESILLIGASGKTGMAVARRLASVSHIQLHALARSPAKLKPNDMFDSVIKGNARDEADIDNALQQTRATWVVISIGNGTDVSRTDVRTANAVATAAVLQKSSFSHVRVLVVSSIGAGSSKMNIGFGLGKLVAFHLRHVLRDRTGQEETFWAALGRRRVTIVRTTPLTDNSPTGGLFIFGDMDRCPTIQTDRADLANWIANEICGVSPKLKSGGAVNVTSLPKNC